jgi:drug/metabolite transporter (DMT)-like permease
VPDRKAAALGAAYIVASALCFGAMPIFARAAYADGVDTPTLLLLRFAMAAALLWALFLVRGGRLPGRRGLLMLAGMGGIGYAGQAFSYFTALTLASAGLVALLLYLYPALVTLLSRLLGHHLSGAQVALVGMALLGSVLTIGRAGDGKPLGIFFGLLAALIYSGYILVGSRLPGDVTPAASSALVSTSAGLVYGAVALFRGVKLPQSAAGWGAVAAIAVVCTVLAIAFFLAGLSRIGPVKASIYSTVEPAFTLLLAGLLLGETVTALRLLGGALIIGAVILLARLDLRRAPQ